MCDYLFELWCGSKSKYLNFICARFVWSEHNDRFLCVLNFKVKWFLYYLFYSISLHSFDSPIPIGQKANAKSWARYFQLPHIYKCTHKHLPRAFAGGVQKRNDRVHCQTSPNYGFHLEYILYIHIYIIIRHLYIFQKCVDCVRGCEWLLTLMHARLPDRVHHMAHFCELFAQQWLGIARVFDRVCHYVPRRIRRICDWLKVSGELYTLYLTYISIDCPRRIYNVSWTCIYTVLYEQSA